VKAFPIPMLTALRVLLLVSALLACTSLARAADGPLDATAASQARFERIRRDPAAASDPAVIDELAREVDRFPPGMTRVEARMFIAEAWLHRMNRPDEGLAVLRRVVSDPYADPLTSALAEREIVDTLIMRGRPDEAVAEAHARANLLDARLVLRVERLARRKWFERAAGIVLAAFVALAVRALIRAHRRGSLSDALRAPLALAPIAFAFVAFVAIGGGILAARYESGSAKPFLILGAASWPLVLVARAWSAVGSLRPAVRAGRALLCGATLLAAAFVLLDTVSPDYLEGFGL
jgi:hypothetical protein